jgi:Arc/MetJ-type ribon-helix-helix transcriptional regulator
MNKKMAKVTINLPEETVEQIKIWMSERHTNATEIIKQAIRSEKFFDTQEKDKNTVLIKKKDSDELREVIFQR